MSDPGLVRAVGLREIIAITINGIIGAGIFALPAAAGKLLGMASPIAFLIAGAFASIIVLCFAELGSRYDRTGGAYLYALDSFGGAFAFSVGWMFFLARLTSVSALCNAMIGFWTHFFPVITPVREFMILAIFLVVGGTNYIGIRFSSRLINAITAAKLVPLIIFISIGILFVDWKIFSAVRMPALQPLSETLLLAMFVFSGFEITNVAGGEILQPQKNLPRGLLMGALTTVVIYFLIQIVVVATLPDPGSSKSPIADSATGFLGKGAGSLISAGAILSTLGTMLALVLAAPRVLYAMALEKQMPSFLAAIHNRFRTPHVATVLVTAAATLLTITGTFSKLATLSAMARLVTYAGCAIALLKLRKTHPSPGTFRIPGGSVIPVLTIVLSLFLLSAATREQWLIGAAALFASLLFYAVSVVNQRS